MKSVVMRNQEGRGIMIREDGQFVAREGMQESAGTVITQNRKASGKGLMRGMITAAAALALFIGIGAYAYATPYYYTSVDVNPSIEMQSNIFGKVIGLEAVNEDGKSIVAEMKYKHQNAEKVLNDLVARMGDAGYFTNAENALLIATASKDEKKAAVLEMKLEKAAAQELKRQGAGNEILGAHYGYDMVQSAKGWGMTPGKYNIVTHLLGYTITTQAEADMYMNMSVKDLMKLYKEMKGQDKGNSDKQPGENNGSIRGNAPEDRVDDDPDSEVDGD